MKSLQDNTWTFLKRSMYLNLSMVSFRLLHEKTSNPMHLNRSFIAKKYKPRYGQGGIQPPWLQSTLVQRGWLSAMYVAQAFVQHQWNLVSIAISYFIQDSVCFRALLLEPGVNRMALIERQTRLSILLIPLILSKNKASYYWNVSRHYQNITSRHQCTRRDTFCLFCDVSMTISEVISEFFFML